MLTRRQTLAFLGAAPVAAMLPGGVSLAAAATDRRLVVVILRGGLDGLAAVPPYSDPDYVRQRGVLAQEAPGPDGGTLDLDGRFGLHPALKPLHDLYRQRQLIAFHAVATPYRKRSHFDAQDVLESGAVAPGRVRDGWLNRALSLYPQNEKRLGLAVGQTVPLILRGDTPVGSWAPRKKIPRADDDFMDRMAALYKRDKLLGPALNEGIAAQEMSDEVLGADMGGKGKKLRGAQALPTLAGSVGKLLSHSTGARLAVLEVGGWDTHANQGVLTGRLARNLKALATGVQTLKTEMADVWDKSAVLIVTEFGRTVRPNGTNGTDHGMGGVAFLAGGGVQGGRVVADWPGLADARLHEGRDLKPTLDVNAVQAAVAIDHLGLSARAVAAQVFPRNTALKPQQGLFHSPA